MGCGDARERGQFSPTPGAAANADRGHPNVLVITVCSVRADHLGPWGHPGHSPTIDKLAASGTVFEHAWSNATFTLPAHAALLTGLLPSHVGVMEASDRLGTAAPTLPEVLGLYGYNTVAWSTVSSAASFRKGEGLERGFASFVQGADSASQGAFYGALSAQDKPWFALVHFKNAHPPYGGLDRTEAPPVQEWVNALAQPHSGPGTEDPAAKLVQAMNMDPVVREQVYARYDRAMEATDAEIARLLGVLDARGMLAGTVIIVAGDHGESLGEGDIIGHQRLLPKVAQIPLIIDRPDGATDTPRVADDVSLVDLMPTVLELVGATLPAGLDGVSLVDLLDGAEAPPRFQIVQSLTRAPTPAGQAQRYGGEEVLVQGPLWLKRSPSGTWARLYRYGAGWTDVTTTERATLDSMLAERTRRGAAGTWPTQAKPVSEAERAAIRDAGYW